MYATQRLYFQSNTFRAGAQKIGRSLAEMFVNLQKGIEAAKVAEKDPTDREAILRVLSGK